jgi:predicted nucleic acid-binding protein
VAYLVDTSAWVEYFRGTGSRAHLTLRGMVRRAQPIAGVTEPVVMELLAGSRDSGNFRKLRRVMNAMPLLKMFPEGDFTEAGALFAVMRDNGVTIRSQVDCLIAAIAWRTEATLVHADADFDRIAERYPLQVMSLI